jgi:NAD(P)-dependent dehydrogenase (short-subunit alcohol dehydrogenase family)
MHTVIVTGASRGLGEAVVRDLNRRGAAIVATARSTDALAALADELDNVVALAGDVSSDSHRRAVVEAALHRFGRIDALVNNAAILEPIARSADAEAADWAHHLDVNVVAPVHLTALALPALREAHGRVVNVSSGAATRALEGWGAYCTAKAALKMATEVLAAEEPEITAISLRPGVVDTAMQRTIRDEGRAVMGKAGHDRFVRLHADGELLDPAVPGAAIAALALHAPASMSGEFVSWDDPSVQALP